jgi:hypothetical protein
MLQILNYTLNNSDWLMTAPIDPLSIAISPKDGGRYKSISSLTWSNIPGFAILSGRNGSGKTQLLEVLAYHFSGATLNNGQPLPVLVQTEGAQYQPDQLGYIPSAGRFSGGGGASLAGLSTVRQQTVQLVQNPQGHRADINNWVRSQKAQKLLAGLNVHGVDPNTFTDQLKDDLEPVPEICTGR